MTCRDASESPCSRVIPFIEEASAALPHNNSIATTLNPRNNVMNRPLCHNISIKPPTASNRYPA